MGETYARGSVNGRTGAWEFVFFVDTGATWIGLLETDIIALGLEEIPNGVIEIETGNGIIARQTYVATGALEGVAFADTAVPAPRRMVGYKLLQELGFVVNLVDERIELWTGDNAGHRHRGG